MLGEKPLEIRLKYEGRCIVCDRAMGVGERALWQRGAGVAHPWHFAVKEREQENLLDRFLRRIL